MATSEWSKLPDVSSRVPSCRMTRRTKRGHLTLSAEINRVDFAFDRYAFGRLDDRVGSQGGDGGFVVADFGQDGVGVGTGFGCESVQFAAAVCHLEA